MQLRDAVAELQELEVVLRDRPRLLDFPSLRDGREVYLCWQDGEDAIGFWHEPEAGFAGRQPIDDGWLARRTFRAARVLNVEQRGAAAGALLLILSAFGSFSFVEAAFVLLAAGVLALLMARAEGMRFHLPFGDGTVIAGAGIWAGALIVAGLLDRGVGQNVFAPPAPCCSSSRARASAPSPRRRRARGRPQHTPDQAAAPPRRPGAAAEVDADHGAASPPEFKPYEPEEGAAASRAGRPGRLASVTPTTASAS